MARDVIGLDECRDWYQSLPETEQDDIDPIVDLLVEYGPMLRFPHSSGIASSTFSQMRELRIHHAGRPDSGMGMFLFASTTKKTNGAPRRRDGLVAPELPQRCRSVSDLLVSC